MTMMGALGFVACFFVHSLRALCVLFCHQVFDLFTEPVYNGYMAAAFKNYTINWTPKARIDGR